MRIFRCMKEVKNEEGTIALFKRGEVYVTVLGGQGIYLTVLDETNTEHSIGNDSEDWFKERFQEVYIDYLLEYLLEDTNDKWGIINRLVAERVMNWRCEVLPNRSLGIHYTENYWLDEDTGNKISISNFKPSESYKDAWLVAEKLGIAVLPQSDGEGFSWFACDIDQIRYMGDRIQVVEKNDSGVSAITAPKAICLASIYSVENETKQ